MGIFDSVKTVGVTFSVCLHSGEITRKKTIHKLLSSLVKVNFLTNSLFNLRWEIESGNNRSQSVMYSIYFKKTICKKTGRSHGVMVSTLDFESSDPSSNLGGTWDR